MPKSLHTPTQQHLLQLLVKLRRSKNLTQEAVGRKLRRPQSFVAKYEGGERRLDVIEFIEIVRTLGADPCDVLNELLGE